MELNQQKAARLVSLLLFVLGSVNLAAARSKEEYMVQFADRIEYYTTVHGNLTIKEQPFTVEACFKNFAKMPYDWTWVFCYKSAPGHGNKALCEREGFCSVSVKIERDTNRILAFVGKNEHESRVNGTCVTFDITEKVAIQNRAAHYCPWELGPWQTLQYEFRYHNGAVYAEVVDKNVIRGARINDIPSLALEIYLYVFGAVVVLIAVFFWTWTCFIFPRNAARGDTRSCCILSLNVIGLKRYRERRVVPAPAPPAEVNDATVPKE